jgi:hypothetical protein
MATDKPRITISLTQEQYNTLHRLSTLQGMPMSRLVSDLVAEVAPVLDKVSDALAIAAKAQQNVKVNLRRVVTEAEEDFRPIVAQVMNQFDMFAGQLENMVAGAGGEATRDAQAAGDDSGAVDPRPVITGVRKSQRDPVRGIGEGQGVSKKVVKSARSSTSPRAK